MMRRHPKKNKVSVIQTIPHELVTEILSRVAAASLLDISNAKLSCKMLNKFAEDSYVYKYVSLDKFPVVSWAPFNEQQRRFLSKCRQSANPELVYREAILDYFNRGETGSACEKLDKASKCGHVGALYVTCIVLLLSGDYELKQRGIKLMANIMKSGPLMKRKFRSCGKKLTDELKQMWVNNPVLREKPKICTLHRRRRRRNQWTDEEEEDDDDECEACCADREVELISSRYNGY